MTQGANPSLRHVTYGLDVMAYIAHRRNGPSLEAEQLVVAADAAARALEQDPWDEEVALLLMRAHQAQGPARRPPHL